MSLQNEKFAVLICLIAKKIISFAVFVSFIAQFFFLSIFDMFFEIFFEKVKKYLPIFPFINCKVGNSRLFLKEVVVVYNIIVFLQVDSFKTAGAILSLILLLLTFMLSTTLFTYVFAFVFSNYETCQSAMTTLYFFVSYKLYSYIIVDNSLCGLGMGGGGCYHV